MGNNVVEACEIEWWGIIIDMQDESSEGSQEIGSGNRIDIQPKT